MAGIQFLRIFRTYIVEFARSILDILLLVVRIAFLPYFKLSQYWQETEDKGFAVLAAFFGVAVLGSIGVILAIALALFAFILWPLAVLGLSVYCAALYPQYAAAGLGIWAAVRTLRRHFDNRFGFQAPAPSLGYEREADGRRRVKIRRDTRRKFGIGKIGKTGIPKRWLSIWKPLSLNRDGTDRALASEVARLKEKLKAREEEIEALRLQLSHLKADFDSYRRRAAGENEELRLHAGAELIKELLPVLDDLDRALAVAQTEGGKEALAAGVDMIRRQLLEILKREGLAVIEAVGRPFDPFFHEAAAVEEVSDPNLEDFVVGEFRRGYLLRGRVLRPALVKVAKTRAE